jgi:predicted amidohydrolase YtcJ
VLTADPTAVPTEEVKSIRAALTMAGGRIVHRDGI